MMESISDFRDAVQDWICGTNYTQPVLQDNLKENSSGLSGFNEKILQNTCLVDTLTAIPHALAIILFPLVLICIRCCVGLKGTINTRYLLKFPGHGRRWLSTLMLIIILVGSAVEGALTDARFRYQSKPTQPHLYIPDACAILATILSILFNHQMEVWRRPKMAWVLVLYWLTAIGANTLYLMHLDYHQLAEANIATFDFAVIIVILHALLLLNEVNVIRLKAS